MQQGTINVGYWITKWASLRPEKIALYSEGRPFTFRHLSDRVNRIANLLNDLEIRKGDRIGLLLHNSHEYIEIFFALCQVGAILVPLNFRLVQSEIEFILKDCGTAALFFGSEFAELIGRVCETVSPPLKKLVCIGGTAPPWAWAYETLLAEKADRLITPSPEVDGEDPLIIMYTSGTTGVPKGATLSHRKTFTIP